MAETPVPYVDEKLLAYLELKFPNHLPTSMDVTDREIAAKIGEQRVIRHLQHLVKEQNDLRAIKHGSLLETY